VINYSEDIVGMEMKLFCVRCGCPYGIIVCKGDSYCEPISLADRLNVTTTYCGEWD
jgi:hypothetical protein